jgi:tetrahydromethanopterin S-methyltransferase subunit F
MNRDKQGVEADSNARLAETCWFGGLEMTGTSGENIGYVFSGLIVGS